MGSFRPKVLHVASLLFHCYAAIKFFIEIFNVLISFSYKYMTLYLIKNKFPVTF